MKNNLYLDTTNYDLVVTDAFNLKFTTTLTEYVSQKIEQVLKWFYGEWFLNQQGGIPYYERILKKQADLDEVNNIFLVAVTNIPEIQKVIEFSTAYDGDTRKYTIDFKVLAAEVVVEGEVTI